MNNANDLIKLATTEMPFGKYKGRMLIDLPEDYILWFQKEGYPEGKLGELMGLLYEIKLNGLEYLVRELEEYNG